MSCWPQITVTIIEGQQLAGLDIDPVIMIELGTEYRYTSIRQSSNCPYYNEYFVFNFHETPAMIFDKMISISVSYCFANNPTIEKLMILCFSF